MTNRTGKKFLARWGKQLVRYCHHHQTKSRLFLNFPTQYIALLSLHSHTSQIPPKKAQKKRETAAQRLSFFPPDKEARNSM